MRSNTNLISIDSSEPTTHPQNAQSQMHTRQLTLNNIINLLEVHHALEIEMPGDFIAEYFNIAGERKLDTYLSLFQTRNREVLTLQKLRIIILSDAYGKNSDQNYQSQKDCITDINNRSFEEVSDDPLVPWDMFRSSSVKTIHKLCRIYGTKESAHKALDITVSVFSKFFADNNLTFRALTYFTAQSLSNHLGNDFDQPLTPTIGENITKTHVILKSKSRASYVVTSYPSLRLVSQHTQPLVIESNRDSQQQEKPVLRLTLSNIVDMILKHSGKKQRDISQALISRSLNIETNTVRKYIPLFLDEDGQPIKMNILVELTAKNKHLNLTSLSGKKYDEMKDLTLSSINEFSLAPLKNLYNAITFYCNKAKNGSYHSYAGAIGIARPRSINFFGDFNITCEMLVSFTETQLESILLTEFDKPLSQKSADLLSAAYKEMMNQQTTTTTRSIMNATESPPAIPASLLGTARSLPPASNFAGQPYSPFNFFSSTSHAGADVIEEDANNLNYFTSQH